MASGRNPPTAGGDDSKEQAAQWHAQWVDDVALFDRVLCRLALVVGADDGGRSASLDYGTRPGLLASRRRGTSSTTRSMCAAQLVWHRRDRADDALRRASCGDVACLRVG